MSHVRPLQGSCSCGRYNYIVLIPLDTSARNEVHIHFGTDSDNRRSHASLLTAWLRVPLSWYKSHTIAFLPDERHDLIQRTFTPVHEPSCQRKFCGFCGTQMTYWTEEPLEEQGYMHVTLGSLRGGDIEALEDMELLPVEAEQDNTISSPTVTESTTVTNLDTTGSELAQNSPEDGLVRTFRHGRTGPLSWFEEMIEGSRLSRTHKTRRGQGRSRDGTTTIQWEISEYNENEDVDSDVDMEPPHPVPVAGSKRKLDV